MARLCKLAVVSALVVTLGAHWALLQTVAWVGMIITYSQETTLAEAVEMTFDGEHPCRLCKVIKAGRAAEKKQDAEKGSTGGKVELAVLPANQPFIFFSDRPLIPVSDAQAAARRPAPPKPRPRVLPSGGIG